MRFLVALLFIMSALSLTAQEATNCTPLTDPQRSGLIQYVKVKYKVPDAVSLSLIGDKVLPKTCFHQLTFAGKSPVKTWELSLFLSPDHRYLMSDLLDTTLDPAEEERRNSQALMAALSLNKGASLGPEHAAVTIVEFSDFQCPYCRKLAGIMNEVLPSEEGNVRVVFHHMPLSSHSWAREAAEGAGCAELQGSKAFWPMHDELFRQQTEITADNVKPKMLQIAKTIPALDVTSFQACVEDEMSLGLVMRDVDLAVSNEVTGTPTLFINGHRVQGVKDASQLRSLIAEALKERGTVASAVAGAAPGN